MNTRLPLILPLIVFSICETVCQDLSRHEITSMFADPAEVEWHRNFRGMVDEVHPVRMALAYNGSTYRGRYAMIQSDEVYDLVGKDNDGELLLEEIDHNGLVSGYIRGALRDQRFNGQWWSIDMQRSVPIDLIPDNLVELKTFEPEVRIINGSIDASDTYIVLTKETPMVVSVSVETEEDMLYGSGVCKNNTCQSIVFDLTGAGEQRASLNMTRTSVEWQIKLQHSDDIMRHGSGEEEAVYPVERIVLSDYNTLIDCMYPKTGRDAFDAWIEEQLTAWSTVMQSETHTAGKGHSPQMRWKVRGYAWIDLFLLNNIVASGMVTMYDPGRGRYERESFIYDLDAEEIIGLESLARGSEDLEQVLFQKTQTLPSAANGSLQYEHVCMGAAGFVVRTGFDPVYGDYMTKVPYAGVMKSIRRNAVTNSVMR